mgnify:CR=1 FL=1
MNYKELSRQPQSCATYMWYYEVSRGLVVYYEPKNGVGRLVGVIPWENVAVSLKRYRKVKAGR